MAAEPAVTARALSLSKKMSLEEVFQQIGLACLQHIEANRGGVADHYDAEHLHQMRVGVRRLRSALRMVRPLVGVPKDIDEDLRWLGEALGAARDWDVLLESTLPALAADAPEGQAQFDAVRQAARAIAVRKHEEAAQAVRSPRFKRMMQGLARWFGSRGWRGKGGKDLRAPVKPFAREALRRDRQRLNKRGKHLKGADAAARHRVRVAAKKSRYDTEFFQSLYRKRQVRPYVKALASMQDTLGLLNDLNVAERLLHELPSQDDNVAFTRGYLLSRLHGDDAALLKKWKALAALELKV